MLRRILAGLKGIFGWCLGAIGMAITFPFRLFGGGYAPALPEIRQPGPMPSLTRPPTGLTPADLAKSDARNAGMIISWAAEHVRTGAAVVPDRLPRGVKSWLPGLRHGELMALIKADLQRVSDHISGKGLIAGVPKVGPLPAQPPRILAVTGPEADDDQDLDDVLSLTLRPRAMPRRGRRAPAA
jgi:hypothetical protein